MRTIKDRLLREIQDSGIEGVGYLLESSRVESEINIMHGSIARASLNNCYYAYIIGDKYLFENFLLRVIRLCEKAIELKIECDWEPKVVHTIYEAYAGATWLYTGQDDSAIWKECLEYTNLWFFEEKNPIDFSKTKAKGINQDLFYTYLQRCLFAKEYKLGIDVYEYFTGKKEVKLTSKTGVLTLMYAILRHYEYDEFDKTKLNKVCRQVLGKELKYVYSKGRPDDAVYWLKTMCALREQPYTTEKVILTFYEFLEDDEIPDEIKALLKDKGLLTRTELIAQKLI